MTYRSPLYVEAGRRNGVSNYSDIKRVITDYIRSAGTEIYDPEKGLLGEVDPEFIAHMIAAMVISYYKYGKVRDAYPEKFDALADCRARIAKYRETGNKAYLADAANFCMMESMFPKREGGACWDGNDAKDSPGRTSNDSRRLLHENNQGERIIGEGISPAVWAE